MTRAGRLAALWALAAGLHGCSRREASDAPPSLGPQVRVQVLPDQSGPVGIRAGGKVRVETLPDHVLRFEGSLPRGATVAGEGEGFRLAGAFYPSPIRLVPEGGRPIGVRVAGVGGPEVEGGWRSYRGTLDLINTEQRIRAINELSLEEYLAGVVGAEMPSDFPAAALECQAVVSRSYALYSLGAWGPRRLSRGFPADTTFQVYAGLAGESPAARRAVRNTAGWVLSYQGKLFPAYFHSTCGGNTTNAAYVFGDGEPDLPPLRGVVCDGCTGAANYRWSLTVSLLELESLLKPWADTHRIAMGELRGLKGLEPLPGGYLRYVRVIHSGGSFEVRSDRFLEILRRGGVSGCKSTSFEVTAGSEPGTLTFRGAGWGHGVGLCQHGAGRKGRNAGYGEVLAHYFPDSELKKLY